MELARHPDFEDGVAVAAWRYAASLGEPLDPATLLSFWERRSIGGPQTSRRYRWGLSVRALPGDPRYGRAPEGFVNWQPGTSELFKRDPTVFGQRIALPVVVSESIAFLHDCAACSDPDLAGRAQTLLTEALPVAEFDVAGFVRAIDPWTDMFALWCLERRGRVLADLRPLATALALRYASIAERSDGIVKGSRFPFYGRPLVSGSAHLAAALRTLGLAPSLLADLTEFVAAERTPGGGWHDPDQPDDVLTTLAAAELLTSLDPSFDPAPTVAFYSQTQEPAGWWRALGPEVPWLTAGIADWIAAIERPFAARFRWPRIAETARDRKTALPTYAFLDDLARLMAATSALGASTIEVAFLDLAGFGGFNNREGQARGDDALRVFAAALAQLPGVMAIRDGGDEFILVGAPTATALRSGLDAFAAGWRGHFSQAFPGVEPMGVRVVETTCRADSLMAARETLGRAIGVHKSVHPESGVVARWMV